MNNSIKNFRSTAASINFEELLDADNRIITSMERDEAASLCWRFNDFQISETQILKHYNAHANYFFSKSNLLNKSDEDFIHYLIGSIAFKEVDELPMEITEFAGKFAMCEMLQGSPLESSLELARELKRSRVIDMEKAEQLAKNFKKKKLISDTAITRVSDLVVASKREVKSL